MPKITFISASDESRTVEIDSGWSLMEGAVENGIEGIDADCGGCLGCATCHVYVDDAWAAKLPAAEDDELEMLDCTAAERRDTSRLSCQINVTDELDGLVVRTPTTQS